MKPATLIALMRAYGLEVRRLAFNQTVRVVHEGNEGWYHITRLADGTIAGAYGVGAPPRNAA